MSITGCCGAGRGFQSFRVRSSLAEPRVRPSGLNVMRRIRPAWPLRMSNVCPLAGSQSRMVLS